MIIIINITEKRVRKQDISSSEACNTPGPRVRADVIWHSHRSHDHQSKCSAKEIEGIGQSDKFIKCKSR